MGREGHKTDPMGCLNIHSTKQTFVYFYVVFFGIFSYFYTSAKWIIKTNDYYDEIVIIAIEDERLCGVCVCVGEGWRMGGVGMKVKWCSSEPALLFKPIDTQTSFGIKIFKQSHSGTCLCFF